MHQRVEDLFGDEFSPEDTRPRAGREFEPAWRNNLDALYDRLKKRGVMLSLPARSPWQLADVGIAESNGLPLVVSDESNLLSNFKPKDASAYLVRLRGRVLRKERLHESLLASYGRAMYACGWRPVTTVHPRDLELRRQGEVWVAEVKLVYDGNATEAARAALAQLLEYRHFFYGPKGVTGMVAVFSEAIGGAHVELLESLGIASVWAVADGWAGGAIARRSGLIPRPAGER